MTMSYQDEKSSLLAHSEAMFFSQTVVEASRCEEINVEPVEWEKVESDSFSFICICLQRFGSEL